MLLTTKRTNRESKSNDCRKQKAATTPLTEGSKRKALKVREWACRADSQLWGGWCSAGACVYELWRRQSEGSVPGFWRQGMAAAEDKTFFCHYRDEILSQKPPTTEDLRKQTNNPNQPRKKQEETSSFLALVLKSFCIHSYW